MNSISSFLPENKTIVQTIPVFLFLNKVTQVIFYKKYQQYLCLILNHFA